MNSLTPELSRCVDRFCQRLPADGVREERGKKRSSDEKDVRGGDRDGVPTPSLGECGEAPRYRRYPPGWRPRQPTVLPAARRAPTKIKHSFFVRSFPAFPNPPIC